MWEKIGDILIYIFLCAQAVVFLRTNGGILAHKRWRSCAQTMAFLRKSGRLVGHEV